LDPDVLHRLQNPLQEPPTLNDDERLSIDVFLAVSNASEQTSAGLLVMITTGWIFRKYYCLVQSPFITIASRCTSTTLTWAGSDILLCHLSFNLSAGPLFAVVSLCLCNFKSYFIFPSAISLYALSTEGSLAPAGDSLLPRLNPEECGLRYPPKLSIPGLVLSDHFQNPKSSHSCPNYYHLYPFHRCVLCQLHQAIELGQKKCTVS
ncbi:hypothetical protein B0H13DRAFT_1611851, partial [Mycena leptocephala]